MLDGNGDDIHCNPDEFRESEFTHQVDKRIFGYQLTYAPK